MKTQRRVSSYFRFARIATLVCFAEFSCFNQGYSYLVSGLSSAQPASSYHSVSQLVSRWSGHFGGAQLPGILNIGRVGIAEMAQGLILLPSRMISTARSLAQEASFAAVQSAQAGLSKASSGKRWLAQRISYVLGKREYWKKSDGRGDAADLPAMRSGYSALEWQPGPASGLRGRARQSLAAFRQRLTEIFYPAFAMAAPAAADDANLKLNSAAN